MARTRKTGAAPKPPGGRPRGDAIDPESFVAMIAMCQKALKWLTITIMISILLVIGMTTVSTGTFVQLAGKGLYFVVVGAAVLSLSIWSVRVHIQKRLHRGDLRAAGILKKIQLPSAGRTI